MKPKYSRAKRTFSVFMLCGFAAQGSPAQTLTTLFSFDGANGANPNGGLVQALNGDLYGTTFDGGAHASGTVARMSRGKLTNVYSFCSLANCADGLEPNAPLVQTAHGYLYGTTYTGGAYSRGTVFKISPKGALTTLYSFCSAQQTNCLDGYNPGAGLVQASNGYFYGTTDFGGTTSQGTIFQITPTGTLT